MIKGVYAVFSAPTDPDLADPVMRSEAVFERGEEGIRQDNGASLWM